MLIITFRCRFLISQLVCCVGIFLGSFGWVHAQTASTTPADKIPKCVVKERDRYQRLVAECFIGKESLSKFMVREGYAVAYVQYSKDFIEDEKYAKQNKLGIWSMNFQMPSEYRKSLRSK